MEGEPPTKKPALERNGSAAYIPEKSDGDSNVTITFSLEEKKGALSRALKLFDVSRSVAATELFSFKSWFDLFPCRISEST